MPATMKKGDVKYQVANLTDVDWERVKTISRKPIPTIAKNMVKNLLTT